MSAVPEPECGLLVRILREARYAPGINAVATVAARAVLRPLGLSTNWCKLHLPRVGKVCARLPNGRRLVLRATRNEPNANSVFWDGWAGCEPQASRYFFALARKSSLTLDVGAHIGYYSLLAAHANPRGRVVAFEPLPRVFELLRESIALNGVSNVDCEMSAAGREDGEATFYFRDEPAPTSSSLSYKFMKKCPEPASIMIPVVALDRYLAERSLGPVGLMKIDTETTEPGVLRGMAQVLRRDRPHLLCEVLGHEGTGPDLEELLRPLGYSFYQLIDAGPARRERIDGPALWSNYLFTTMAHDAVKRLA